MKAEDEKGNVRQYNYNQLKSIKGWEKPEGSVMEAEEKEYEVGYWYRSGKYGDDKDYEVWKGKASSEEEAIKKAKEDAPRSAYSFKVAK